MTVGAVGVSTTATLHGARDHARSQSVAASAMVRHLGADGYLTCHVGRGRILQIFDTLGRAYVALVAYNAAHPIERLNVADTVKVQWQAYLGPGAQLLSDMGRVLATIVTDTSGRHDALCGATRAASDRLALAGAKVGLAKRDIPPPIGLFTRAVVGPHGELTLDPERRAGCVELRAELDLVVLLANGRHPIDTATVGVPAPVEVRCLAGEMAADPPEWLTPERSRARERSEAYVEGWG